LKKTKIKKVKAAGNITLRAPLKEIPNEYWDKVEVENEWDGEYKEATRSQGFGNDGRTVRTGNKEIPMMASVSVPAPNL